MPRPRAGFRRAWCIHQVLHFPVTMSLGAFMDEFCLTLNRVAWQKESTLNDLGMMDIRVVQWEQIGRQFDQRGLIHLFVQARCITFFEQKMVLTMSIPRTMGSIMEPGLFTILQRGRVVMGHSIQTHITKPKNSEMDYQKP